MNAEQTALLDLGPESPVRYAQHARARRTDPLESHLAAAHADIKLTETQDRVLVALRMGGPGTDEQIQARFSDWWPDYKVSPQSIRSRRKELVTVGLVEATGEYGVSSYGNGSAIWKAVASEGEAV